LAAAWQCGQAVSMNSSATTFRDNGLTMLLLFAVTKMPVPA
jgi:hypothetical protein